MSGAVARRLTGALTLALAGCAGAPPAVAPLPPAAALPVSAALDRAAEDRVLALVPERISAEEVRQVLGRAPAPRIINLHGSVALVTMAPFADFLVAMGYPAASLRHPRDGATSQSSFADSAMLAGTIAWYYEREGMMPLLIGHSQGGMLVVKTLHELAGAFRREIPVWNPVADAPEARTAIVDPATGARRPVVGLRVPYAAALATGKLPRVLLGQWDMLPLLRQVPDTVEEFTGFFIAWDPIAGTFGASDPYRPTGTATVRNVTLPAAYSHIGLPLTRHLAENAATRAWIEGYAPGDRAPAPPAGAGVDDSNIIHAAELWHSVKKHWCREAQRQIRARRARATAAAF
ncbi:MAG: hypothetical protein KJ025_07930 [Burkholderiales bacterium]|nr:hypothetical protein [Burkholderiales bacterium]